MSKFKFVVWNTDKAGKADGWFSINDSIAEAKKSVEQCYRSAIASKSRVLKYKILVSKQQDVGTKLLPGTVIFNGSIAEFIS